MIDSLEQFLQIYSDIRFNPCKMIGKTDKSVQLHLYQVPIIHFINTENELYQISVFLQLKTKLLAYIQPPVKNSRV